MRLPAADTAAGTPLQSHHRRHPVPGVHHCTRKHKPAAPLPMGNWPGTSGKKICVRTYRQRPDAPGTWDALDAPCQRTYRSQCEMHRQCEFGRSSLRHLLTGQSVVGHFPSGCTVSGHFPSGRTVSGHFPSGRTVSGHFPSGRSRVRAFSYWTYPDDACHSTTVTLAVKAQNIAANTTRVAFANTQWVPGIVTQSSSILYI